MILDTSKYLGACACGHEHTLRTKLVVCEHGALKNFDKYMEDAGLSGFRTVIYDTNTYNLPSITHVQADQEIVLEAKGLHSEKGLIEDCMTRFVQKPDYVVVVGGGTLMDFGRYSAWKLGIPFVAIPTIVSSDGFTADICSIIIDGQKKSIPMQAADAVICDIDVVAGAPMFLTIAGVQDIMAKVISIADWKIASLVSGEYFCQKVCDMAQEALDLMTKCAYDLKAGKEPDIETMAYTQMLSGLTMQILSNSRAASGAEHLVAHLVEMKPRGFENAHGLHGECVGVGTLLVAEAYHKLAERESIEVKPFTPIDEEWVRWEFGDLADGILKENENDVLATFPPENIKEHWQEIREIIAGIPSYEELRSLYAAIGAKHTLEELGIDPAVKDSFLDISSAIRNRLTLARMTRLICD
ncbi:MAG: iron-containing alcohol dehydrogenase [Oscillospiraceae bacterium]|nr:iron-containing alcohol dehydrogenase [Oscillospiraceae bacterium]